MFTNKHGGKRDLVMHHLIRPLPVGRTEEDNEAQRVGQHGELRVQKGGVDFKFRSELQSQVLSTSRKLGAQARPAPKLPMQTANLTEANRPR